MNIVIADDHDLVRDALATLLERDDPQCVVFHAGDFYQAQKIVQEKPEIDLALLDVNMPGMKHLQAIQDMLAERPQIKIVLMSGIVKQTEIAKGFELGARGFVSKSMNGSALVSVLHLVLSGARYVPDLVLERQESGEAVDEMVSKREKEVLAELAKGLSNKVIARNLSVEETTVKLHLRSVFRKLGTSNRTETVIRARELGLIV